MNFYHKTVLLQETVDLLRVEPGKLFIDATLGGGGLAKAILDKGGKLLGIDLDDDALSYSGKLLKDYDDKVLVKGNFKDIDEIASKHGFQKIEGIVVDLGLSSHQIDDKTRGFSYVGDALLDMRMDQSQAIKASDLLNIAGKDKLYEIFTEFGQEPRSRAITNSIISARRIKAFQNSRDLTEIIDKVYRIGKGAPMKIKAQAYNRIFQGLRMAVNDELTNLTAVLPKALNLLEKGGRLVVISFHSLEDRIVKQAFLDFEKKGLGVVLTQKPITPSFTEITDNRRSKSAKLRAIERL